MICGPTALKSDVKALPERDLVQLAEEVREELVRVLSDQNPTSVGGHLGPNLGVVELTIALHRVFETPKDNSAKVMDEIPMSPGV